MLDNLTPFLLIPLLNGYSYRVTDQYLTSNAGAGLSRRRKIMAVDRVDVSVSFMVKDAALDYFWRFHDEYGASLNQMRLKIRSNQLAWHAFKFAEGVPDSVDMGNGLHMITVALQARAKQFDPVTNQEFVSLYNATGGQPYLFADLLDQLVNEDLPEALGDV